MAALLPLFRHATRATPAVADAELLTRFADRRDEDAFAELVRRHGPVVYRICNRLVGPSGADDAFQAVFLVLATRLSAAKAAGSLAAWLVGVAGRVARQMRRAAYRRTKHENAAASRPSEGEEKTCDLTEQFRALDEELARLPDHLRDPVVLCFLQGRNQEEAAAELGRDARTLRRRLERAKNVLRARLERRGVVPAVAVALLAGSGAVSATVPPDLTPRAVKTVFDFLTGGTASAASAPVVLAKGVATTMFARKLIHALSGIAAGLIGLGVVLAGDGPPTAAPAPPTLKASAALPAPQPATKAAPVAPPVAQAAPAPLDFDWKKDEILTRGMIENTRRNPDAADKCVYISAMCMTAPAGFCENSGLTTEELTGTWTLTPREQRMLTAIMRAEKEKGKLDILCRPTLCVCEGKTGFAHVGQQVPVVTGVIAEQTNGKTVRKPKVSMVDLGVTLRVTPKIAADGQFVELKVESQIVEPVAAPVEHPIPADKRPATIPAVSSHSLQATCVLPDGGALVIRSAKPDVETLWVLTAHIVRNDKKLDATPAPVPSSAPTPPSAMPAMPVMPPPQR